MATVQPTAPALQPKVATANGSAEVKADTTAAGGTFPMDYYPGCASGEFPQQQLSNLLQTLLPLIQLRFKDPETAVDIRHRPHQ
jgi:hypothetical protein